MESATVITLWLAFAAAALSAVAFWRVALTTQPPSRGHTGAMATALPAESTGHHLSAARTAALLAGVTLVTAIVLRTLDAARPPWTNMWEFTVAFAASVAAAYIAFDLILRPGPALGGLIQSGIAALLLIAGLFFSPRVEPLVPALQSEGILALHVGFMLLAYGALSLSFGSATLRLLAGRVRNVVLPSPATLDRVAYGSVAVGFPLLTLGILLGAYWANDAWGRYWAWDPKETAALVTWLVYAGYLHVHRLPGWKGRRDGLVLIGGYTAVLFTYFGVNLWISGLHSYA